MYKHIEIEVDEFGRYVSAIVFLQHSDNNLEVKKRYNIIDIRQDLKDFAFQNNMSIEELKNDYNVVKFKRNGSVVLPSKTYNYELPITSKDEKRNYRARKYYLEDEPKKEHWISRKVLAIATVGVIAVVGIASSINYAIRRDTALNNHYIKPLSTTNQQFSPQMLDILNDYEEFDQIMKSLVNEDYASLKDQNLGKFYGYLNTILSSNNGKLVTHNNKTQTAEVPSYKINLSDYFPVDSIDNIAVSSFENQLNLLVYFSNVSSKKELKNSMEYPKRRALDFVYNDTYQIGVDSKGEKVYYCINNLSPIARYMILIGIRPIITTTNATYKNYDNKQVLEKINSMIIWSCDQIRTNIENSNNRTL